MPIKFPKDFFSGVATSVQ